MRWCTVECPRSLLVLVTRCRLYCLCTDRAQTAEDPSYLQKVP